MKLIFITDTHGMASNPGSRLDTFSEAMLNKMRYVGEYANEIGASAILHGGDWLHTPDVSEGFIRDLAMVVNNYPCPTLGVLGNHDIYGYNPATFNRTAFGVAEGCGVFERLGAEPRILMNGFNSASITGQDSYFDLDKEGHIGDYTNTKTTKGSVNIHIVHGMLVERDWPMVTCTTLAQVMDNNPSADIILTGHEHTGFGVKEFYRSDGMGKVIFCNPGSLLRVTAGTGDIRKDARMAVITIEDGDYRVELVNLPLNIARPASEVLDADKLAAEKANKENLQSFITKMNSVTIRNDFNVYESLNNLCEGEDINEEVLNECRSQLEKAEEQMKKED